MKYVRDTYGVPAKRGMRVQYREGREWKFGSITYATHYVFVRPEGVGRRRLFHPSDLIYYNAQGEQIWSKYEE